MSVFLDTSVFYAHHDRDSERHDVAMDAMETLAAGQYGRLYSSEYVYDEALTLTIGRTSHEAACRLGRRIRGESDEANVVELLFVDRELLEDAVEIFEQYDDQRLSFTDATTIAIVDSRDIDHVCTFDDDLDGICPRLAPAEI